MTLMGGVGVEPLGPPLGQFSIFVMTSWPLTILPKTGCFDWVLISNQSKYLLSFVLMKNCDPLLFTRPEFAMLSVHFRFESLLMFSSKILPCGVRLYSMVP